MSGFLNVAAVDETPADYVARIGRIETDFSHRTQGSGNVSWIVDALEGRVAEFATAWESARW